MEEDGQRGRENVFFFFFSWGERKTREREARKLWTGTKKKLARERRKREKPSPRPDVPRLLELPPNPRLPQDPVVVGEVERRADVRLREVLVALSGLLFVAGEELLLSPYLSLLGRRRCFLPPPLLGLPRQTVVFLKSVKNDLGCLDPGGDRCVDPLDSGHDERPGGAAEKRPAGEVEPRQRLPASLVERPCAVGAAGPPLEELADFWVGLEALELLRGFGQGGRKKKVEGGREGGSEGGTAERE